MKYFEYLFRPSLVTGPFSNLRTLKWRAEQMLTKVERTADEIDNAAKSLRGAIDEHNENRAKDEFERHIERLYTRGGWELSYLENIDEERGATREEIRQLLEYWPEWAEDRPDFPRAEDFDDLESLQDLWLFRPSYAFNSVLNFVDDNEYLSYALLALMKLESVAETLYLSEKRLHEGAPSFPAKGSMPTHVAVWSGNTLVEAMEIICYAERAFADSNAAKRAESESKIKDKAEQERKELERRAESEKARALANIRWAEDAEKRLAAKSLIKRYWDLWTNDRSLYKNQGDFARDMEEKVEVEIGLTAKQKLVYSANTIEVKLIPAMRAG